MMQPQTWTSSEAYKAGDVVSGGGGVIYRMVDKVEPEPRHKCALIQCRDKAGVLRWYHPTKGWRGKVWQGKASA